MYIDFSNSHPAEASLSLSKASRLLGVPIGQKYIQRIGIIKSVDKFNELLGFKALQLHSLKDNLEGQYSMTLTRNFRLIIKKIQEDRIIIMDVEDYHGN